MVKECEMKRKVYGLVHGITEVSNECEIASEIQNLIFFRHMHSITYLCYMYIFNIQ